MAVQSLTAMESKYNEPSEGDNGSGAGPVSRARIPLTLNPRNKGFTRIPPTLVDTTSRPAGHASRRRTHWRNEQGADARNKTHKKKSTKNMKDDHRSALRGGTSRFGFAGVPNAPNIDLGHLKHKERARVSALRFLWGANRTKKAQQTPFAQPAWFACCDRPCLGSLCSVQCNAGRCAMLRAMQGSGAVQCCALCDAGRSVALGAVKRWAQ